MTENQIHIEIHINKSFKLFDESYKRIQYFSCIANTLDCKNLPVEWEVINENSGVTYSMLQPSEDDKCNLVRDFRFFLYRYMIRDCIESFAICLDDVCFKLLLLSKPSRFCPSNKSLFDALDNDEKEFLNKFRSNGISGKDGKVTLLRKHFKLQISDNHKEIIKGLKDIRDCLAHNNGIVRSKDGHESKGGKVRFAWMTLYAYIFDKKNKKKLKVDVAKNHTLEEGGDVSLEIQKHKKLVKVGEPLVFTQLEAYEIALSLHFIATRYIKECEKINTKQKS